MKLKCPKCGREVDYTNKYCIGCGTKLVDDSAVSVGNVNVSPPQKTEYGVYQNVNSVGQKRNFSSVYIVAAICVATVLVCSGMIITSVFLSGRNYDYDEAVYESKSTTVEEPTEPVTQAEIVTEAEVVTEAVTVQETVTTQPQTTGEPTNYQDYVNALISGAYSVGWLQTTNTHNTSYMLDYTTADTQAFNLLGQQYWQQRPNVYFNYINNVQIYGIEKKYDGCYTVYVSYDYELYNGSSGKISSNTELTVDEVKWVDGRYILSEHNWKNDVPKGTYVTRSNFS